MPAHCGPQMFQAPDQLAGTGTDARKLHRDARVFGDRRGLANREFHPTVEFEPGTAQFVDHAGCAPVFVPSQQDLLSQGVVGEDLALLHADQGVDRWKAPFNSPLKRCLLEARHFDLGLGAQHVALGAQFGRLPKFDSGERPDPMLAPEVVLSRAKLDAIDQPGPLLIRLGGGYRGAVRLDNGIVCELCSGSFDALFVIDGWRRWGSASRREQAHENSNSETIGHGRRAAHYITARANSTLRTCPTPS